MKRQSKRKYPRIPYQGRVDLKFEDQHYKACETTNLCLSGLWVKGCLEQEEGGCCEIEFQGAGGVIQNRTIRLRGEVVRRDHEGIALLFVDMNLRHYTTLEALIQSQGQDPFQEADAFLEEVLSQ